MGQNSGKPGKASETFKNGTSNWSHQTVWTRDNLNIMREMSSACADLLYLDPLFNSNANDAAPIGSQVVGAESKDTWTLQELDITWLDLIEAKHLMLNCVIYASMKHGDKSYFGLYDGETDGHHEQSPLPHLKQPVDPCRPYSRLTFSW